MISAEVNGRLGREGGTVKNPAPWLMCKEEPPPPPPTLPLPGEEGADLAPKAVPIVVDIRLEGDLLSIFNPKALLTRLVGVVTTSFLPKDPNPDPDPPPPAPSP